MFVFALAFLLYCIVLRTSAAIWRVQWMNECMNNSQHVKMLYSLLYDLFSNSPGPIKV